METDAIGPAQAIKEGWLLFRRHHTVLLGGFLIFLFLLIVCAKLPIPYLNWALLLAVAFPLLGGLHILFLNAAKDANPCLANIFCGFQQYKRWSVTGFVFTGIALMLFFSTALVSFVTVTWSLIYLRPTLAPGEDELGRTVTLAALLFSILPAVGLFSEYAFTLFVSTVVFDVNQAVTISRKLVKGKRLMVFLSLLLALILPATLLALGYVVRETNANAFGWPGWVVFFFSLTIVTVVALCAFTATYVHLNGHFSESQQAKPGFSL